MLATRLAIGATLVLGAAAFQPASSRALQRSAASSGQRTSRRAGSVRASADAITISQPTEATVRELYDVAVRTWTFDAVGEVPFAGAGPFGDRVGEVVPASPARQLTERLGAGCSRYVFAGSGTLSAAGRAYEVGPNSMVDIARDTELTWSLADGCDVLVLAAPEYDNPARRAVRAQSRRTRRARAPARRAPLAPGPRPPPPVAQARSALPLVLPAFALVAVLAVASEGLAGNW